MKSHPMGKRIRFEAVRVDGRVYNLDLRCVDHGVTRTQRFTFQVLHEDPPIDERGPDLSVLVRAAETLLRSQLSIEWAPFIEVYVDAEDNCVYASEGEALFQAKLAVRASLLDIGTRPDGTKLHRIRSKGFGSSTHYTTHDGMPEDAVVPDTPANRARLQVIADGLQRLATNLTSMLSQDRVLKTLQDVRMLGMLAPPAAEPEVSKRDSKDKGSRPRARRSK